MLEYVARSELTLHVEMPFGVLVRGFNVCTLHNKVEDLLERARRVIVFKDIGEFTRIKCVKGTISVLLNPVFNLFLYNN